MAQLAGSVEYTYCRGLRLSQWVSWYDTKQSDGEAPVMLELCGMQNTPLLQSLPDPLWPGPIYGVLILKWIVWNRIVYMYKNGFDIK